MKNFIHPDFLLETKTAKDIYHQYAENLLFIDCHCHLPPKRIAEDHNFDDIGEIWLESDHYN